MQIYRAQTELWREPTVKYVYTCKPYGLLIKPSRLLRLELEFLTVGVPGSENLNGVAANFAIIKNLLRFTVFEKNLNRKFFEAKGAAHTLSHIL
jgi:hypothetical protein